MPSITRSIILVNFCLFATTHTMAEPRPRMRTSPHDVPLNLDATITPSPLHTIGNGDLVVAGQIFDDAIEHVRVRVTDDRGQAVTTRVPVTNRRFRCAYPGDFDGAKPLRVGFLFVDATGADRFGTAFQAEVTVIIHDPTTPYPPEFPSAFTNDLVDADGRTDAKAREWPVIRKLVNRYMHSRAATICRVGHSEFDLANARDLNWYKNNLTLYEHDYRDRDWSTPLNHRLARTFWQAVWDTWFDSSNNNPIDGNDANNDPTNYHAYAFTNDFSDTLILYLMRLDLPRVLDDNLDTICREGLRNFMNFQHREPSSFAHRDARGREHVYTAGAFRYGMFEHGKYLTEGTGWFYNPNHHDYINGGVFNGRAIWAIGEGYKRYHDTPLGPELARTMELGVQYCLHDALEPGYAKRTPSGKPYWYDAGETGYLLLGMLAACEAIDLDQTALPALAVLTIDTLDALVELMQPHGQWQMYADKDPIVIAALADGVRIFANHPSEELRAKTEAWKKAAVTATDSWLDVVVDRDEYPAKLVHFGSRRIEKYRMSFLWDWSENDPGRTHIVFYISGHWIHALAKMYRLTGNERYRARAEAMVRYFCGANPWKVRLLNELGGVYNYVQDTDRDGIEDCLIQDMYPESTSFVQIGMNHLFNAIHHRAATPK